MDGENTNGGQEATQGGTQEQEVQGQQQESQAAQEVSGNAGNDWEKQIAQRDPFPECKDTATLLSLTRRAFAEATQPKVSYEVDAVAIGANDCELGDELAVIDTSRNPE